jgi:hypothetical protein
MDPITFRHSLTPCEGGPNVTGMDSVEVTIPRSERRKPSLELVQNIWAQPGRKLAIVS